MSEIEIYKYPHVTSADLRVVSREQEPWFVAKDVTRLLRLGNMAMALRVLDPREKGVNPIDTPGGTQKMVVINKAGLYRLMMRSDKAEARRFQDWIIYDVLPSYERTGAYMDPAVQGRLESLIGELQARIHELESAPKALPSGNETKRPKARCPQGHNTWGKDQYGGAFWYCSACHHAGNTPFRIFFDK
jgi:prophage antirepressor-like protein